MGQGRKEVGGFVSDFELLVRGHIVQGPHVVQTVGQFDEYHPNVIGQGQEHFAEVLKLLRGIRGFVVKSRDFGQAIDDAGHNIPKLVFDFPERQAGVLQRIVQEGCYDARCAQADFFGCDSGYLDGMKDVGLPRPPTHVLVGIYSDFKGPPNELSVGLVQKRSTGFEEAAVAFRNFLDFLIGR